jgi:hypothetical protein
MSQPAEKITDMNLGDKPGTLIFPQSSGVPASRLPAGRQGRLVIPSGGIVRLRLMRTLCSVPARRQFGLSLRQAGFD